MGSESAARPSWEDRLAALMFWLAVLFLIVLAGLIHRFPRPDATDGEIYFILALLIGLWLLLLAEGLFQFFMTRRTVRLGTRLERIARVAILPPLRLGVRNPARDNAIWLPWLGWQTVDADLRRRLERAFSIPMIVIALLVLPVLLIEYGWAEQVRAHPTLSLFLDISISIIWLAFALEFVVMVSVAERPLSYCLAHWVDLAIVCLPLVEALPIFRLLRLGKIMRLEQLTRMGRLYRLQGLAFKAWRAVLLLDVLQRITGQKPEIRLRRLQEMLQAREEEACQLRKEISELKALLETAGSAKAPGDIPTIEKNS